MLLHQNRYQMRRNWMYEEGKLGVVMLGFCHGHVGRSTLETLQSLLRIAWYELISRLGP